MGNKHDSPAPFVSQLLEQPLRSFVTMSFVSFVSHHRPDRLCEVSTFWSNVGRIFSPPMSYRDPLKNHLATSSTGEMVKAGKMAISQSVRDKT